MRERCGACGGRRIGVRGPNVGEHYRVCPECDRAVVVDLPYPQPCPVRAEDDEAKKEWGHFGWTRAGGWPAQGLKRFLQRNKQQKQRFHIGEMTNAQNR